MNTIYIFSQQKIYMIMRPEIIILKKIPNVTRVCILGDEHGCIQIRLREIYVICINICFGHFYPMQNQSKKYIRNVY